MPRSARLSLPVLLLALAAGACLADEPPRAGGEAGRTISLPREGLSVAVPDGWSIHQYGEATLLLEKDGARVRVRPASGSAPAAPAPAGAFSETTRVLREGKPVYAVDVLVPREHLDWKGAVEGIVSSIDATPFEEGTRHVDWVDGWTMDLPEGWVKKPTKDGTAFFEAPDGSSRIRAGRWKAAPAGAPAPALQASADAAWKATLQEIAKGDGFSATGTPSTETLDFGGGVEGRRTYQTLAPKQKGAPEGEVLLVFASGVRAWAFCRDRGAPACAEATDALRSFEPRANPGPRAGQGVLQRFPGDRGPKVGFRLPEGWSVGPGQNSMRLAELHFDGVQNVEAVVYFFGQGGGGSVEANLERWKGQMEAKKPASTDVFDAGPGVKVHLLDVTGSYDGGMGTQNPHAAPPSGSHEDFRMLAAVIEVEGGPLFVKLVGPAATVADEAQPFRAWLESIRPLP